MQLCSCREIFLNSFQLMKLTFPVHFQTQKQQPRECGMKLLYYFKNHLYPTRYFNWQKRSFIRGVILIFWLQVGTTWSETSYQQSALFLMRANSVWTLRTSALECYFVRRSIISSAIVWMYKVCGKTMNRDQRCLQMWCSMCIKRPIVFAIILTCSTMVHCVSILQGRWSRTESLDP